jgi:outer membrane lipoprotein-sorting protein
MTKAMKRVAVIGPFFGQNGLLMNTNRNHLAQRFLVLVVAFIGLLTGIGVLCPTRIVAQTADEIVAKVLAARGGLEKTKAVQTERITGTIYFNPELYGPFLAEFKRPGKMRNEVTIQNKTVVRSFNGKDVGWVTNPFTGKDAPELMSAEEVKDAVNEADFDGPLVDAKAKGNVIELSGTEKVEGRDTYILKVTHKDGQVSSYSFDAKTFLLAKWSGADTVNGETVTRETYFHDYRDVGGLKFAFELVSNTPGADVTQRIVVDKIEIDPQIDEGRFGKPPAPATSSSGRPASVRTAGR